MKQKIKDFVFGVPKTEWVLDALMITIGVHFLAVLAINAFGGKWEIASWIMVAFMWFFFYWFSNHEKDDLIRRQRKLIDDLLEDNKRCLDMLREVGRQIEVTEGVRRML